MLIPVTLLSGCWEDANGTNMTNMADMEILAYQGGYRSYAHYALYADMTCYPPAYPDITRYDSSGTNSND